MANTVDPSGAFVGGGHPATGSGARRGDIVGIAGANPTPPAMTTPTSGQRVRSVKSSVIIALQGWRDQIVDAANRAPGDILGFSETRALEAALDAALAALDDLHTAQEQIGTFMASEELSRKARFNRAADGVDAAVKAAQSAINTLQTSADALAKRVAAAWKPSSKPAGADSTLIVDRKSDLCLILVTTRGDTAPRILDTAADELHTALANGDDLTAYVLAGGPMDLWYRAKGITPGDLALRFAAVVGSGGGELAALTGRGEGTLNAFIQGARQELATIQAATRETLSNLAATLSYGS